MRVSYFIRPGDNILDIIKSFISNSDFEYAREIAPPETKEVSDAYGKEELRFRRYLSTYSLIGLDLMTKDLFHTRCLFSTFRFQIMASRLPFKPHFESIFEKNSPYYCSMTQANKDEFWSNFSHWPNPPQADWAHMFVNMVLGRDWFDLFSLPPQAPITIQEINKILDFNNMGFRIPDDWTP